jgi:serine/threonine protein kinase/Tol biopolymer transport system component
MALVIGTRLGPYEVNALIGEGGMGQVYRATDMNLGRQVAVKVLPDAFASDPDRLARFEREAKTLASLNHPNIAQIYGLERADGTRALVMELVEGETLVERIVRGPIPVDEALTIAKQIAEALEAAHEQGIIHRDLKPANIKLRSDGTVKVLDFGLAKAMAPMPLAVEATTAPTITSPVMMTGVGVLLGTAAYMAPEQARGKAVDKRCDIWAYGCVLYEMLTGQRAFDGDDIPAVIARVLEREPDFGALPPATPLQIRKLLRRCLNKDRRRRLADAADARLEIEDATGAPEHPPLPERVSLFHRSRVAWAIMVVFAAGFLAMIAFVVWGFVARPPDVTSAVRLSFSLPPGWTVQPSGTNGFSYLAVSHDGRRIAMVASTGTERMIWLRSLDTLDAQPLAGTDGALSPFWSPDDRSLGFFAGGKLKKIDIAGGPPVTLCDAPDNRGGSWSRDGMILFSVGQTGLRLVAATGGLATTVTKLAEGETGHARPHFLPDGRRFLFSPFSSSKNRAIYVGTLGTTERVKILDSESGQYFYSAGHLLFLRDTTLMAQAFDPDRLTLTGEAFPIADRIQIFGAANLFSAGDVAVLAYQTNAAPADRAQLQWFDRAGKPLGVLGEPGDYSVVELSPDGQHAVIGLGLGSTGASDLWLYDITRGVRTRFTFDPTNDLAPAWSSDGDRIAFQRTNRGGNSDVYQKLASGAGRDEPLLATAANEANPVWSPDGRYVLYRMVGSGVPDELWVLPLIGDQRPFPFLQTPFDLGHHQFSPDGRWVAYTSVESGREEVYVTSYPKAVGKWQISTEGGSWPRWRGDGRELFHLDPGNRIMAADVDGRGQSIQTGVVRALFESRAVLRGGYPYAVSDDGQRVLINSFTERPTTPISIVVNWTADLTKR